MKTKPRILILSIMLLTALLAGACTKASPTPMATTPPAQLATKSPLPASPSPSPAKLIPDGLTTSDGGDPILDVYITQEEAIRQMPLEEYLQGVLAGEMRNDWPMEALKAQAIIARTFALKFIEDKGGSSYEGAHVSTDVKEAQAYNAEEVNERIIQAIDETRGQVITYENELTYTWFHSHSGGVTSAAKEGLEWEGEEPPYIQSVPSTESNQAPEDAAQWTATFTQAELLPVLNEMGFGFDSINTMTLGEKGASGRALTFSINDTPVTAPSLRIRLDPAKFRSTLLDSVQYANGTLTLTGRGYGHGVGMSQWGAFEMAEQGKTAEQIIRNYYTGVDIQNAWE